MTTEFILEGVSYHAPMPIGWQPADSLSAAALELQMYRNAALLRALATLESAPMDKESELGPAMVKAVEHLEAKIDLVLTLVADLLAQNTALPPPCPVTLTAQAIQWITPTGPAPGGDILISLYLSPKLPQALVLPATVAATLPQEGGTRIQANLRHLSEEAQDWLERTLFRYHRRAIQTRSRGQAD